VLAIHLLDLGERFSAESLLEQANALKQLDDLELFSEALSRLLVVKVAAAQSAAARQAASWRYALKPLLQRVLAFGPRVFFLLAFVTFGGSRSVELPSKAVLGLLEVDEVQEDGCKRSDEGHETTDVAKHVKEGVDDTAIGALVAAQLVVYHGEAAPLFARANRAFELDFPVLVLHLSQAIDRDEPVVI